MEDHRKLRLNFCFFTGLVYLGFGILLLLRALGLGLPSMGTINIESDPAGGLLLILIAAIFLSGVQDIKAGLREGVAHMYVGIVLSLFFAVIYALAMATGAMEAWLAGEEASYTIGPVIYLGILPLAGLVKWRTGFSLKARVS